MRAPSGKRQKESKFCFFRIRLDFHFGWTAKLHLTGPPTKLLLAAPGCFGGRRGCLAAVMRYSADFPSQCAHALRAGF